MKLDPNALYLNNKPIDPSSFTTNPSGYEIPEGATCDIMIQESPLDSSLNGKTSTIKIVAIGGTFATTSTKLNNAGGGGGQYSVQFILGTGGVSTSPTGTQTYVEGAVVPISATAGSGYTFSSWSATGSIVIASASSASTTATINGAGTITANFWIVLFNNGFEEGDFSAWSGYFKETNSVLEVTTDASHSGNYGMHGTTTGVSGNSMAYVYKTTTSAATYYTRFYFYATSLPANEYQDLFYHYAGANLVMAGVCRSTTLQLLMIDGAGYTEYSTGSYTFTTGQWYCVEFETAIGNPGTASFWINGNLIGSVTGVNNAYGNIDTVLIGSCYHGSDGTGTFDFYIDDVVVDSSYIGSEAP